MDEVRLQVLKHRVVRKEEGPSGSQETVSFFGDCDRCHRYVIYVFVVPMVTPVARVGKKKLVTLSSPLVHANKDV